MRRENYPFEKDDMKMRVAKFWWLPLLMYLKHKKPDQSNQQDRDFLAAKEASIIDSRAFSSTING